MNRSFLSVALFTRYPASSAVEKGLEVLSVGSPKIKTVSMGCRL